MKITHEEMVAAFGPAEEVRDRLERFGRTSEALSRQWPELVDRYDGKWIAAYDCEIVGVADSHEELRTQLAERGLSSASAVVEYVTREPAILIL